MSTEEGPVYWITRWALTEGILRWEPEEPDDVSVVDGVLVIRRWNTDYSNQGGPSATERQPAHLAPHEWDARGAGEARREEQQLVGLGDRVRPPVARGSASPMARGWNVDRLGAYLEGVEMPGNLFLDMLVPSRFFEDRAGNRAAASAVFRAYAERFGRITSAVCTVMPRPSKGPKKT